MIQPFCEISAHLGIEYKVTLEKIPELLFLVGSSLCDTSELELSLQDSVPLTPKWFVTQISRAAVGQPRGVWCLLQVQGLWLQEQPVLHTGRRGGLSHRCCGRCLQPAAALAAPLPRPRRRHPQPQHPPHQGLCGYWAGGEFKVITEIFLYRTRNVVFPPKSGQTECWFLFPCQNCWRWLWNHSYVT